jgi:hypothetical protein
MYCYPKNVERDTAKTAEDNSQVSAFEALAASQGVCPVVDFDVLLGHHSAEDETAEEFSAMLREWRREGDAPPRTR